MLDGSNNKLDELRNEQIKTKTSIKLNARIIINPCTLLQTYFAKTVLVQPGTKKGQVFSSFKKVVDFKCFQLKGSC